MTLTPLGAVTLGIILEGIFYGVYVVLFILCLILRRRNIHRVDGPLILAQVLLFGLCTTSLCLDVSENYFTVIQDVRGAYSVELGWLVIFIMIDCLAQTILLYRCWIVWDQRWAVVAVPGLLVLVTLVQECVFIGLTVTNFSLQSADPEQPFGRRTGAIGITAYFISLGVNALTTSLIVIKIFLTSREVRPVSGSNLYQPLRVVAAMLIGSGLLMFAFQLVFVVLFCTRPTMFNIISSPTAQVYGITPTLLNIWVIMGTAYDKTTEKTASLRFAHSEGAATQTSFMSVAEGQSWGINPEFNDGLHSERAIGYAI